MISPSTTVVVTPEQVSSALVGESVILNLKTGMYYSLNAVGASVWELLQTPHTVQDIYEAILDEYEVDPQQCRQEVSDLLQELLTVQLIEVQDASIA